MSVGTGVVTKVVVTVDAVTDEPHCHAPQCYAFESRDVSNCKTYCCCQVLIILLVDVKKINVESCTHLLDCSYKYQ